MGFSVLIDGKAVRLSGRLPLLPLRDVVLFPGMVLPLFVGRPCSVAAIDKAASSRKILFTATQRRPEVSIPRQGDLHEMGVVARIRQVLRLPDGTMRVLVEGLRRAELKGLQIGGEMLTAHVAPGPPEGGTGGEIRKLLCETQSIFLEYARLDRRVNDDGWTAVKAIEDPVEASYLMASHLQIKIPARQELLETPDAMTRLQLLSRLLTAESEVARLERKMESRARKGRIQNEADVEAPAGPGRRLPNREMDEGAAELAELEDRVRKARMPNPVQVKALRELDRLSKMAFLSPEATVSRTYIDWLIAMPWRKRTRDRADLTKAEAILNDEHYGLQPVKERILELLAVLQLSRKVRGPVLCLIGPPGVGKTSLGRSVAHALNRRFIRMSLGGVRDEAEIRGHRRTYIGAMPGRIAQAMRRAGSVNPVILLDEVDKLGVDYRGDPAAALLEVLDPEQNHAFNDNYLEIDYDLSRVLFLTTANSQAGIPPALADRMEIIRLPGYLETEKIAIAARHLLRKQLEANGLDKDELRIPDDALGRIVREYTREAGVRSLEREVARICRRVARCKATGLSEQPGEVGASQIEEYLGVPRFRDNPLERRDRVGIATGLAWSEVGGSALQVEVGVLPGRGRLILTGKLGSVMRESAQAALSCVRARAESLGLDRMFHRHVDIHVHIPEGGVPKEGPSAGATIALAMVSALTETPTRRSVALTGELTLRGQVLPVGGLSEKAVAAMRSGIRTVLVPAGNERHIAEVPEEVRRSLRFVTVRTLDQVLRHGLGRKRRPAAASSSAEARHTDAA